MIILVNVISQSQIHYLGHIVSREGVAVDPDKIKVIMGWTTTKNNWFLKGMENLKERPK